MLLSIVTTAGLCLATMFMAANARATERLSFLGAVVEPTCAVLVSDVALLKLQRGRNSCATTHAAAASRMFALEVTRLNGSVGDKVLQYFDSYVRASRADAMDPLLVVQTYE